MPKTLLVVDHSPTIREAARLALEGEDWVVTAAATADEALETSAAQPFDAVLCDAALAGVDLCRRLRALPGFRDVPVLLMGASAAPKDVEAAGASGFLAKPFGSQELADALQGALDVQGFSLDLDALGPAAEEEPLTLEELDPSLSDSPSNGSGVEELEIIDLSGGEEFAELELIEDLELVEEPGPPRAGSAAAQADRAGEISLELNDLFAAPASPRAASLPADELLATARPPSFGTAAPHSGEPLPAIELSAYEPLGDADFLEPLNADRPPADDGWAFEPEPQPVPFDLEEPLAPPRAVASAAAPAVTAALPPHLDAESLAPVIERVVERVAWEVVPRLAERLIREAIEKLQTDPPTA